MNAANSTGPDRPSRLLRFALGIAQMVSATAAVLLLLQQGMTTLALIAVVVACVLSTLSVLLFGGRGSR